MLPPSKEGMIENLNKNIKERPKLPSAEENSNEF